MRFYTCWITCMLESYQDTIVAELIKKGYTVGLAGVGKVSVNKPNQVSAVIALTVYKMGEENILITKVYEEVSTILTDIKIYAFSLIISESSNATWAGSNIYIQVPQKISQLPPIDDKK